MAKPLLPLGRVDPSATVALAIARAVVRSLLEHEDLLLKLLVLVENLGQARLELALSGLETIASVVLGELLDAALETALLHLVRLQEALMLFLQRAVLGFELLATVLDLGQEAVAVLVQAGDVTDTALGLDSLLEEIDRGPSLAQGNVDLLHLELESFLLAPLLVQLSVHAFKDFF